MEVTRIKERTDGIKYCLVPKNSSLTKGDLVKIIKLREEDEDGGEQKRSKTIEVYP